MNNAKRVLTFALAVCSLSAFASCGSSSDSSSKVVDKKLKEDQQQIVQRLADDMKDVRDLKSNEIKWFSHWDINPTEAEGKWNWDTFTEMCLDFTDAESDKYALDGWYYEKALQQSSGVPLIGITDGKLVNNISDPMIAKAQNMMYELQKNNVVYPKHENNWKLRGDAEGSGMATGLTLFYPIGLWALENAPSTTVNYGDVSKGEVMFVPVPCSADSDKQYIPSRVHGFSIVKNAQNPEGVAAFLECCRYAELDEAAHQITLDQYKDDYGWTDEMLEMRETIYDLSAQNPVFDFEQGVSADLNSICDTAIRGTMNPQESKSWSQVVQENEKAIDYLIDEAMTSMKEAK